MIMMVVVTYSVLIMLLLVSGGMNVENWFRCTYLYAWIVGVLMFMDHRHVYGAGYVFIGVIAFIFSKIKDR